MQVCQLEQWMACAMLVAASAVFMMLKSGITAPYGRFSAQACKMWPRVDNRMAWMVSWTLQNSSYTWHNISNVWLPVKTQEMWSFLVPCWLLLEHRRLPPLQLLPFLAHYFYRSFLYPLLLRPSKATPLHVWAAASMFTAYNGLLQVCWAAQMHQLGHQLQPSKCHTAAGHQPDLLLR